ncbi:MAG TPA: hypothetical protein PLL72_14725 [Burkholderiaceae bacterium]|nr:hypothetical protein [Burkholderiaceae bacterium]
MLAPVIAAAIMGLSTPSTISAVICWLNPPAMAEYIPCITTSAICSPSCAPVSVPSRPCSITLARSDEAPNTMGSIAASSSPRPAMLPAAASALP